jgi:MFS family permease
MSTVASAIAARRALLAIFLVHGLLLGSWAPHVPLAKQRAGVDVDLFGLVLLAMALGAIAAMLAAGALIQRHGSATMTRLGTLAFCATFLLPVVAGDATAIALGLLVFGAAIGTMDVAMNAHGVEVERRLGRPILSTLHGCYSVGAMIGSAAGGPLLAALGALAHGALVAGAAVVVSLLALPALRGAARPAPAGGATVAWPTRRTALIGTLCLVGMMAEGAILDWSALHLVTERGAGTAVAPLGFALFSGGMALSRFLGDALRARFDAARILQASALASAAGLALAVLAPAPAIAVAGYAVAGFGLGNVVPILFALGADADPRRPGHGIAAVTTLGYAGFVAGPPLIGIVAAQIGLTGALGLLVPACLAILPAIRLGAAIPSRRPSA